MHSANVDQHMAYLGRSGRVFAAFLGCWLPFCDVNAPLSSAQAQDIGQEQSAVRLDLALGINLGAATTFPHESRFESQKYGFNLGGKALAALSTSSVALDAGLGWMLSRVQGSPVKQISSRGPDQEFIRTRTGFFDIAARARVGERLQVGPIALVTFGTDSSFAPWDEGQKPNVFLGAQILSVRNSPDSTLRYGFEILTDLTISGRQVVWLALTTHLGVPVATQTSETQIKVNEVVHEVVKFETREKFATVFESQFVTFNGDLAILTPRSQEFLRDLALVLKEKSGIWQNIEVTAHTDLRDAQKNQNSDLSQARANAVMAALIASGIPESRLKAKGLGAQNPLDPSSTPEALTRNRRIELIFSNVKDFALLNSVLTSLKNRYYSPETCNYEGCR